MNLKSKAIHAFGWNFSDKLINQLGNIAVTIYLARLIGPESFGFIGMLTIFILLADSIVSGGFTSALVQRSHQLTEDDACTVFWINLGWGVLMYSALYIAAPWIAQFYRQPELLDMARVLFLVIIINTLTVVVRAKLIITIDFKSQAIANTFATLLSSGLALVMAQRGYGYWALVFLMVSKALLVSAAVWWFCRWMPQVRFSRTSFNSLFGFGSNLMLAGFVATIINNLYVAIVGRFNNATEVGFYTQATNLSNSLYHFIESSLQGVAYPILTSIKDDRERMVSIYKKLISLTMLVSLPTMVGFAAIADDLVSLFFGEEWLPMIPVLVALCIARTITPISVINMGILNAVGRSDLFLKVDLIKLPMSLGVLYIAFLYGIQGLAWASVCTSFIAFFINAWFPGKMFGFGGLAQLRQALPYIAASMLMFAAVHFVPLGTSYLGVAGKITLGFLVYVVLIVAMGDVWAKEFLSMTRSRICGAK
jgi:O-antigen/teichoic acid export membrane protein